MFEKCNDGQGSRQKDLDNHYRVLSTTETCQLLPEANGSRKAAVSRMRATLVSCKHCRIRSIPVKRSSCERPEWVLLGDSLIVLEPDTSRQPDVAATIELNSAPR